MSTNRFGVIEVPGGWWVIEHTNEGDRMIGRRCKTEADAVAAMAKRTAQWLLMGAVKLVRKRSGERCECLGECDRGHKARCPHRHGERGRIPETEVKLTVVALNHDDDDLRPENLRHYCQLCRLYHDADADGAVPLFPLGEVIE